MLLMKEGCKLISLYIQRTSSSSSSSSSSSLSHSSFLYRILLSCAIFPLSISFLVSLHLPLIFFHLMHHLSSYSLLTLVLSDSIAIYNAIMNVFQTVFTSFCRSKKKMMKMKGEEEEEEERKTVDRY